MLRTTERRRTALAGAVVVLGTLALAPAAGSQAVPVAELRDVVATECRDDGVDLTGLLVLALPSDAQVDQVFRVVGGGASVELDTATTPMPAQVDVTQPYADSVRFGGTWTAGLPFTYEIQLTASVGGQVVADQTVQVPCTATGAPGATPDGAAPDGATPARTAAATPVTGSPRFTG